MTSHPQLLKFYWFLYSMTSLILNSDLFSSALQFLSCYHFVSIDHLNPNLVSLTLPLLLSFFFLSIHKEILQTLWAVFNLTSLVINFFVIFQIKGNGFLLVASSAILGLCFPCHHSLRFDQQILLILLFSYGLATLIMILDAIFTWASSSRFAY